MTEFETQNKAIKETFETIEKMKNFYEEEIKRLRIRLILMEAERGISKSQKQ